MHEKAAQKGKKTRQNNTKYAPRPVARRDIVWYNKTLENCCVDLLIRSLWDGDYIPKIIQSQENGGVDLVREAGRAFSKYSRMSS
jgi:hypothetical protein